LIESSCNSIHSFITHIIFSYFDYAITALTISLPAYFDKLQYLLERVSKGLRISVRSAILTEVVKGIDGV